MTIPINCINVLVLSIILSAFGERNRLSYLSRTSLTSLTENKQQPCLSFPICIDQLIFMLVLAQQIFSCKEVEVT